MRPLGSSCERIVNIEVTCLPGLLSDFLPGTMVTPYCMSYCCGDVTRFSPELGGHHTLETLLEELDRQMSLFKEHGLRCLILVIGSGLILGHLLCPRHCAGPGCGGRHDRVCACLSSLCGQLDSLRLG